MGRYAGKTDAELAFIVKDATEAADCARAMGHDANESKYRDQVNDAVTERYQRQQAGKRRGARTGNVATRPRESRSMMLVAA